MEQLKRSILGTFSSGVNVLLAESADETGEFEVVCQGELLHSKLGGAGYGHTPEATSRIIAAIRKKVGGTGGEVPKKASNEQAAQEKKALIVSICSLLLSIPALIGA